MKKMLLITDNYYVSATLFHGFGLPPWYDLPVIQDDPAYRNRMTDQVNAVIARARQAGYAEFDVHEAFPVNLKTLAGEAMLARGADSFHFERNYSAAGFLSARFDGLEKQPRLQCIGGMTWNDRPVDETDLLALWLAENRVPVVYAEAPSAAFVPRQVDFAGSSILRNLPETRGGTFRIAFDDKDVPLERGRYYPGVLSITDHCLAAEVASIDEALEIYRFAGLLIQKMAKY